MLCLFDDPSPGLEAGCLLAPSVNALLLWLISCDCLGMVATKRSKNPNGRREPRSFALRSISSAVSSLTDTHQPCYLYRVEHNDSRHGVSPLDGGIGVASGAAHINRYAWNVSRFIEAAAALTRGLDDTLSLTCFCVWSLVTTAPPPCFTEV